MFAPWKRYVQCSKNKVVLLVGPNRKHQANNLVNTAIDDLTIASLRAVVLDELHMIDDDHRGYLLELTTTKLLSLDQDVQIIAMSATLPVWLKIFLHDAQ